MKTKFEGGPYLKIITLIVIFNGLPTRGSVDIWLPWISNFQCQNSAIQKLRVLFKHVLMRRSPSSHFKRPIVLSPLPNLKHYSLRPMDPLQPPDLLFIENRLGSPAPKSNIPLDSDHDINSNNGKPIIKITHYETDAPKETGKHEPLLSEYKDFTHKLSKKNPIKIPGLDGKPHDLENMCFNNHSKPQIKNLHYDPDKKLKCPPLDGTEDTKTKVVQIPNRYAPLKPIGQRIQENEK